MIVSLNAASSYSYNSASLFVIHAFRLVCFVQKY